MNKSYFNEIIICKGIVTEISSEFEDASYGFIQIVTVQIIKEENWEINVQHDENIILLEKLIGMLSLGDKVQITGTMIVHNAHDTKASNKAILVKDLIILNDEVFENITEQEIKILDSVAKQPHIQQKLGDAIFENIFINQDIKLIGTLILFCTDSLDLVKKKIPCNLSLIIVGTSGTYKTSFLEAIKKILPINVFHFSQKSDIKFTTYKSRYKKGGEYCQKAGLADFAKNGIILLDNLGELKESRLVELNREFNEILKLSSIISAVHTKNKKYHNKLSVYQNLQFPRKNSLLEKFDLALIATSETAGNLLNIGIDKLFEEKSITENPFISKVLLKKYIKYAKNKFDPQFSERARDKIIEFKEEMIKINKDKKKIRKIDPFNLLRVLTMLCKAYARIAFKNMIESKDIQLIIRICKQSIKNFDLI